jgi:hypothetical protein
MQGVESLIVSAVEVPTRITAGGAVRAGRGSAVAAAAVSAIHFAREMSCIAIRLRRGAFSPRR